MNNNTNVITNNDQEAIKLAIHLAQEHIDEKNKIAADTITAAERLAAGNTAS